MRRQRQPQPPVALANTLLEALPGDDRALLREGAHEVAIRRRRALVGADDPLTHVYFPLSGLVALVTSTASGRTVEIGQVGREGMIGLPAFLGVRHMPVEAVVQVSGTAVAVPVTTLRAMTRDDTPLSRLLKRYTFMRMVEMSQNAACHRWHSLEQRTARWLLETADRARRREFWITHEVLAELLGVQRPRVTEVILKLQSAGLIDSPRERIRLLDTAQLGHTSCECYLVVRHELRRLEDELVP